MTTITRERAQEIFLGNGPEPTASEQRELARIALASLTAKPIAHTSQYGIDRMIRDNAGLLVQAHGGNAYEIPLYTTPPAPVVPEECPAELPYAQVKAVADLFALCWQSGEVVTYTPDPEKATIWLNNYSGTCVQEYVKLERLQEALAGNSQITPDGWKLAPEKADEDMIAEGNIMASCMIETVGKIDVSLIYGAMLAAAPEKETGPCTK
ncbi:hypothetical protein ACQTWC_004308 [Salmonella enterica]|uniref:hypothetical protein n=1 Tax=Salmonella enterica TaxID=28901 RepID=UPI001F057A98|nr:hypothetical protein [Salmonella enterica]MDJ8356154.1 hypothetical protein [Salmonella enterica]